MLQRDNRELIGQVLDGRYEVLECLGSGGMGMVFKARQAQLDRIVAIKVPHAANIASQSSRNRFEREAQTMARFSHENIVQVYDYNATSDRPYIVLEYVRGQELADLLAKSDQISIGGVLNVCAQIANGLDYAHRHGVIHRDIKPENIVISDMRRCVKIMDFGLVRVEGVESKDTRAGFVVGTPQYMSPEQVRGKPVAAASDIYAFAVILYCIFAGRLPFEGDGMALMMRHATEQPPDPMGYNPHMPPVVARAVLKSLHKDPEKRHQTAGELVQEIAGSLRDREAYAYADLLRGEFRQPIGDMMSELFMSAFQPGGGVQAEELDTGSGEAGNVTIAMNRPAAQTLNAALGPLGFRVKIADTAMATLESVLQSPPDALVIAESLGDMRGAALIRLLRTHPIGKVLPIVFLGERSELRFERLSQGTPIQVLSSESTPGDVANFTSAFLKRARDARATGPNQATTPLVMGERNGAVMVPLLRRLDAALIREHTAASLTWSALRADTLHATFQRIGEALRPIHSFRYLYCSFYPGIPGEKGVVLLDKSDQAEGEMLAAILVRLQQEMMACAKRHKDLPNDFHLEFAKGRPGGGDAPTEISTISLQDGFFTVPVEEGPRLFGTFGFAYEGGKPSEERAEELRELAPAAFAALQYSWNLRRMERQREEDETTGVLKRGAIIDYLRLSLSNSSSLDEPFALLLLDVDGLDNFNQTHGLDGADRLLHKVGDLLKKCGPPRFRAGRIGSDEFLLIMPGANIGEAMKTARALLKEINAIKLSTSAADPMVRASIGIAYRGQEEKKPENLIRAANNALAAVKSTGGNNIRASG